MSTLIEKEKISGYRTIPASIDHSARWREKLAYATRLGNEFKGKTMISFATDKGDVSVITTVWHHTEDHIQLKAGIIIPLSSITDIQF